MRTRRRATRIVLAAVSVAAFAPACIVEPEASPGVQSFEIEIQRVGDEIPLPEDAKPPTADAPRPANIGDRSEFVQIAVQAKDELGGNIDFDGDVRITIEPGAVVQVYNAKGEKTQRNLRLKNGKARALVEITAVYGPTRLIAEDLGYRPAEAGDTPACANGENDDPDEDVFVDFPSDPGCAFANDDQEESGSHAAGTSPPLHYALPTLRQVQGGAAETPFAFEGLQVKSDAPQVLVVTRIAKDGFYVTDLADQANGYNHMFAFSFSTPPGLRVCDRITYLAGTMAEFFGFTEMNFPSFEADELFAGEEADCLVPEPALLDGPEIEEEPLIADDQELEKQESGLVRVKGYTIASKFGPELSIGNVFEAETDSGRGRSNCDLNGDGRVDFESEAEGSCSNVCDADPDCSEFTQFLSRGTYKISDGINMIKIATDGAPEFNAEANRGQVIDSVTGSLRNFSGGKLNWTIEVRCPDDLVCAADGCEPEIKPPNEACVSLHPTEDDNDEGTN